MKKYIRIVTMLMVAVMLLCFLPAQAHANGPAPGPWYTFYLTDLPENTVYVDLLIQLPTTDLQYTDLVFENLPENFSEQAQIITYCEDNFRSYTFHYRGAKSQIRLDENNTVTFFVDSSSIYEEGEYDHQKDVESRGRIRLAMLDAQGNIIQMSESLSIRPSGLFSYSLGVFHYNAAQDKLTVESSSNALIIVVFLFISLVGIGVTCFTEWLIALLFDYVKDYSRLIVCTNLASQLLMRIGQVFLLYILFVGGIAVQYFWVVFILEILVYLCEFLFYKKKMRYISWQRCLAYTVCANTASAAIGLWMLRIIF